MGPADCTFDRSGGIPYSKNMSYVISSSRFIYFTLNSTYSKWKPAVTNTFGPHCLVSVIGIFGRCIFNCHIFCNVTYYYVTQNHGYCQKLLLTFASLKTLLHNVYSIRENSNFFPITKILNDCYIEKPAIVLLGEMFYTLSKRSK